MNKAPALSYREMLLELQEWGYSDEQIAVGLGTFFPGNNHPCSVSVYRWRTQRTRPSAMYQSAIELYWKGVSK